MDKLTIEQLEIENSRLKEENSSLVRVIKNAHDIMKRFDEQRAYEYLTNQIQDRGL